MCPGNYFTGIHFCIAVFGDKMLFGELGILFWGKGASYSTLSGQQDNSENTRIIPKRSLQFVLQDGGGSRAALRGMVHKLGDVPEPFMTS